MVTEPLTTPWPAALGTPATESLAVAFAGFDGATARLARVMETPSGRVGPGEVIQAAAELSNVLWHSRSAVEHVARVRAGQQWRTYLDHLEPASDRDLLRACGWARNHAGHALASVARHREGGITLPMTFPISFPPARWVWTLRSELPAPDEHRPAGEAAYDAMLGGHDLAPSIQDMATWLTAADTALTPRDSPARR
jgi:hypothetical protein